MLKILEILQYFLLNSKFIKCNNYLFKVPTGTILKLYCTALRTRGCSVLNFASAGFLAKENENKIVKK